jgi:hypothetical protein
MHSADEMPEIVSFLAWEGLAHEFSIDIDEDARALAWFGCSDPAVELPVENPFVFSGCGRESPEARIPRLIDLDDIISNPAEAHALKLFQHALGRKSEETDILLGEVGDQIPAVSAI